MKKPFSVRRQLAFFYGVALLVVLVIGFGAVLASRSVAQGQALRDAERMTSRMANLVVGPDLIAALSGIPGRRAELDRGIHNRMIDGYLRKVTVWDIDGTVLYADKADMIGRKVAPVPSEVIDAVRNEATHSDFTSQPEATDIVFDGSDAGFVEVYVPFTVSGNRNLAFEAYYDYSQVNVAADQLLWRILPLVLIPLVLLQLIQVPIAASLARRVRRHELERSHLLLRTLSVSEKERMRVAAELHDGPIQDLAGIGYALGGVAPSVPPRDQALMRTVQDTVQRAIESLRRLMIDVYPPDLSASQLAQTIADLAVPLRDKGIAVSVTVESLPDVNTDTVTTVYRVARETLANIVEHAQATKVDIGLGLSRSDSPLEMSGTKGVRSKRPGDAGNEPTPGRSMVLVIVDNGVGIDMARINRRAEGHLGLRILIDHVESLGGTLAFTITPGGGTTVTAALPLTEPSTKKAELTTSAMLAGRTAWLLAAGRRLRPVGRSNAHRSSPVTELLPESVVTKSIAD